VRDLIVGEIQELKVLQRHECLLGNALDLILAQVQPQEVSERGN